MVSKIYHLTPDTRKEKFKSIVDCLGYGGIVNLSKITGMTSKFIIASLGDLAWTESRARKIEAALALGEGFLSDGKTVKPAPYPISNLAGLKSWLAGSPAPSLSDTDEIVCVRMTDVMRLLSGEDVDSRKLTRDGSLSRSKSLVAVFCPEDCPSPLEAGDTAIIELHAKPTPGLPVLAYVPTHGCVLRRYRERHTESRRSYELVSTDADFPSFKVRAPEDAQLLGTVIQLRRNF